MGRAVLLTLRRKLVLRWQQRSPGGAASWTVDLLRRGMQPPYNCRADCSLFSEAPPRCWAVAPYGVEEEEAQSGALALLSKLHHIMVAPLLFAVSAAELLVPTGSILASHIL